MRLCLILLVALTTPVAALDPSRKVWHYGYAQWQDRDGLPQNTVQAIAQTGDGYLWLGTEAGLVRFNGRSFRTFDANNEPSIRNNSVTSLLAKAGGGLWIGTRSGLVLYRDGVFRRWGTNEGLKNETVRALAAAEDGKLWIGTNAGVTFFDGERFLNWWTEEQGLPSSAIRSLAVQGEDLWIGTRNGLGRIRKGRGVRSPEGLPADTIRALLVDRAGRLWIGTETSALHVREGSRLRRMAVRDGLGSDSIRALLQDRDGNLWIGTVGGGLYRWRDGKIEGMTHAQGLASDHVRSLFEDREGSVWVGMEAGGLAQFKDGRVLTLSSVDGLRSDFVRAVRGDLSGNLWIGTEGGGLHRLVNGRAALVKELGLPQAFVTALLPTRDGSLWVGTEGNGAFRLGPRGRESYSTAYGLPENSVWAMAQDATGAVWLGSSNGLVRVAASGQRVFRTTDGLRGNTIRSLHSSADGSLWVGNRTAGLQRLRHGRFESIGLPAGDAAITSFLEEPSGRMWLSSNHGILYWDGSRVHQANAKHGLLSDNLFHVVEDAQGRLWCSSSRGIFSVKKADLLNLFAGTATRLKHSAVTTADGMRSSECSGDAQPAGWRTPDGSLWFATIRGLVQVPADGGPPSLKPPNVVIEQVQINEESNHIASRLRAGVPESGVKVQINEESNHIASGVLRSPPGNRLFSVRFAALTFASPKTTRYRYRLNGRNTDWTEATAQTEAVYHSLPPGDYRFEVSAAHADGPWSSQAAQASLTVAPFFHETKWFYAAMLGVLITLGYVVHRIRTNALRHEFAAVLGERTRIAREIHDTLLQGFAGATLQVNAISRRITREPERARRDLDGVLDQIDECLAEARQEIGELRSDTGSPLPLDERLRQVVSAACAKSGLIPVITCSGQPRAMPARFEKNLLRIARESVANAVRHACARTVCLDLDYDADHVRLTVRDDGTGLVAQGGEGLHFGILGMRERTELMGGSFALRSAANWGTEIEVTLPFRGKS